MTRRAALLFCQLSTELSEPASSTSSQQAWLGFPCKDLLAGAETLRERFSYQHRQDIFWNSVQHSKSMYKCSLMRPERCQTKADSVSMGCTKEQPPPWCAGLYPPHRASCCTGGSPSGAGTARCHWRSWWRCPARRSWSRDSRGRCARCSSSARLPPLPRMLRTQINPTLFSPGSFTY